MSLRTQNRDFVWQAADAVASLMVRAFLLGGNRLNQRRKMGRCQHRTTITTITAGLAREVCEACGRVKIHYVENAVQIYPTPPRLVMETFRSEHETTTAEGPRACDLCRQVATYKIPDGMVCGEHAWQAAARTNWQDTDPWVPILIDKSNA